MDVKQTMREILVAESDAIRNIPVTDAYEKAVGLIVEKIHNKGGKLVTSGMGKCGQIADNIATTFSSTGIPAVFLIEKRFRQGESYEQRDQDWFDRTWQPRHITS